jgi:hypothetical protein
LTYQTTEHARESVVRELVAAGALVRIVGTRGGYLLRAKLGEVVRTLAATRGNERIFVSLDTASSKASEIGAKTFEVDTTHYEAARIRRARPDRAEALRNSRTRPRQQSLV